MSLRFTQLHAFGLLVGGFLLAGCVAPEEGPPPQSPGSDIFLEPDIQTIEEVVPRGATLAGLFAAHDLPGDMAYQLVESIRAVYDPRRLRVGNPYRLVRALDGRFRRFEYHIDDDQFLRVTEASAGGLAFDAERVPYIKERAEIAMGASIDAEHSSLVSALNARGEDVRLAIRIAEVFSGEIDFNNDLRRGDHFEVLFEKFSREDEFAGYGDVLAAEFVNDGRRVRAFRFQLPGDDEPLFYDADGRSMKRLFLKSPFRFEPRITSRFTYRRRHPVLGVNRPHLAVDYGAPTGTPVIAVATGQVVSADMSGGSGNMVRLRHTNGYETYYLHLSAFANGVRPGARVVQGQVIGRVGSTGLATGPHLDYRIRKNGTFVDPLLEHRNLPPGDPVPAEHLDLFYETRDRAFARLSSLPEPAVAGTELAQ